MLPLAHLGIGSLLGRAWPFNLPFRWLLLGTLLPDLMDKADAHRDREQIK
jgi:hypothetical protein